MSSPVLAGLIERRGYLVIEIRRAESALHRLMMDIEHLDATIRQFDRDYKMPFPAMTSLGTGAQVTRIALTILREAGVPLSMATITTSFMKTLGLDHKNAKRYRQIREQVRTALARQRKNGTVISEEGPRHSLLWQIACQVSDPSR